MIQIKLPETPSPLASLGCFENTGLAGITGEIRGLNIKDMLTVEPSGGERALCSRPSKQSTK